MDAFRFINIGFGNTVNAGKIIAIVSPDSAPIRRLVSKARENGRTVDATQGRKTKAVLVMENDRIILSALLPETIRARVQSGREDLMSEMNETENESSNESSNEFSNKMTDREIGSSEDEYHAQQAGE